VRQIEQKRDGTHTKKKMRKSETRGQHKGDVPLMYLCISCFLKNESLCGSKINEIVIVIVIYSSDESSHSVVNVEIQCQYININSNNNKKTYSGVYVHST
jgi:hypothetical protein